ncbi:MAG: cysteine peptidase family C39 domain-containing protein [Lachnospiraceae bacterium]
MYCHNMQNNITDCGIAVLKTVLYQFNKKLPNDFLKEISIDEGQGLSLKDLGEILEIQGIYTDAYEVTKLDEMKTVYMPLIAIMKHDGKNHYVVVHKFDDKKDEFVISDPSKAQICNMDSEAFLECFSGYILCVDHVENISAGTSTKDLYNEIISTINIGTKLKYSIISVIKWGLPIVLLFIMQYLFMFHIEKMNLFNTSMVVILFALLSVGYYYLSVIYQNYKMKLEKKISTKLTMQYLLSEIEIIDNKKNANHTEGIFWNIVISVLGILQKFYLKIDLILITIFIAIIAMVNWLYALMMLAFIALICFYSYKSKDLIKNRQVELIGVSSEMSACIQEMTQSSLDLKIFSNTNTVEKYCNSVYDRYEMVRGKIGHEDMKMQSFYDMCNYIVMALGLAVIFISYTENLEFSSSSMVVAFYMTLFMMMTFKSTFQRWVEYQKSVNAIEYIELMTMSKSVNKGSIRTLGIDEIEEIKIDQLEVRIENRKIICGLNFNAKQGEIIGIKGENGTGKTTLAKTMLGLIRPTKGSIQLNKINLEDSLVNSDITKYVSFYSSELYIYSDSVMNNINFNVLHDKNIEENYSYMNELNLDYLLYLNGINISQGERQKILLDRCLAKNRNIYFFDEPGINLDEAAKVEMLKKFNELKESEKIIIIISHDEEILSCCDRCYLMTEGKLCEI